MDADPAERELAEDMLHIPAGDGPQRIFRAECRSLLAACILRRGRKTGVIMQAAMEVRRDYPDFVAEWDAAYFLGDSSYGHGVRGNP